MGRKVPIDEDWTYLVRILSTAKAPARAFQALRRLKDQARKNLEKSP